MLAMIRLQEELSSHVYDAVLGMCFCGGYGTLDLLHQSIYFRQGEVSAQMDAMQYVFG